MHKHTNEWMIVNARKIEAIQRQLLEHSYAGAYGGAIDLTAVNNLLGGAVLEITKLQFKIEELTKELEKRNEPEQPQPKKAKKV